MKIVIVDYTVGNINSVLFALNRLGVEATLTDKAQLIQTADKVILPGVGAANIAMESLREKGLDKVIIHLKQPVLGICLGMQLLCNYSEENETHCLGIFKQHVKRFPATGKVPHMGWNTIHDLQSPLFKGISENSFVYFVHSYYADISTQAIASTNYLLTYSSALQHNNFYGVQFHPEKSAATGAQILKNFITL